MIKKVVNFLNQLISFFHPYKSHPPPVHDEVPIKDSHQLSHVKRTNLKQCYYCGGAGVLNHSSKLDGFEFSGGMGMRDINTSPHNQCPLCKGKGLIEAQDQVEYS